MTNEEIAKEIAIDHSILDYSDNFITRIHDKNLSKLIIEALNAKDKEIEDKWISVKDELPDADGEVLTWDGLEVAVDWLDIDADTYIEFFSNGGEDVTHWKLPSPPAQKESE